jgi:fumarate hydratase class I
MEPYTHQPLFEKFKDKTPYRLLSKAGVSKLKVGEVEYLQVDPSALTLLAKEALHDVNFFFRPGHLSQLRAILEDPEASENDRFVALTELNNAVVAAQGELPSCQDTGTATLTAKKGHLVLTDGRDEAALSEGIRETYLRQNLRYSQMAALSLFEEKNTGDNLPAQIDLFADEGSEYQFLFLAKGGGSANKTFLFQETKALLNEKSLDTFLKQKLFGLGTAACPPYHLAVVIGGTSAEATTKTVKLASAGYLDGLPTVGNDRGRAFRDIEAENRIREMAWSTGIGAQFGGKYFVHDVRVIRLPRHAASCPVGIGVSCSADRNIKGKITQEGIFLEELEKHPATYIPAQGLAHMVPPVSVDLNRPMNEILAQLSQYPIKTRLSLNGSLIVARDVAHARIQGMLDAGKPMPEYLKNHPVYYAGPAKTPQGMASGSFGPTTAGRMDSYVDQFQSLGGSLIMLAKGNRSSQVTEACKNHGGFYLGSIGGPAAILARDHILKVETVDFEELGMEAVRRIEVKDFPAFIVVDDKGNDFFAPSSH